MSTPAVQGFRELDDLVLNLKGLVLVRGVREEHGADADELAMYRDEIERVRNRLEAVVEETQAALGGDESRIEIADPGRATEAA